MIVNSGLLLNGVVALLFIGLKLTGHLAWGWGRVLSPVWFPCLVVVTVVVVRELYSNIRGV